MSAKLLDRLKLSKKQKKIASAAMATTLAATILLSGTFAWQSISQTAMNKASGVANPGGRLHDYFNGENKDVFVENFTDPNDNGVPIFARIRLDEYMEIGVGAGDLNAVGRNVTVIGKTDAKIDDPSTWITHLPGHLPGGEAGNTHTPMHDYWEWEMGGQTNYMPTFNKDKDSTAADINGTYEGLDGTDGEQDGDTADRYSDYKEYGSAYDVTVGEDGTPSYTLKEPVPENGELIYQATGKETGTGGTQGTEDVTHYAKPTQNATVITMEEWLAMPEEEQIGPYWVYDNDGWAYWAQPIEPGETTGLLLNGIKPQRQPDEEWYYAINVVGQFATAGDWGDKDSSTGFYEDGMTADGEHLLNKVADRLPEVTQMSVVGGYKQYVAVGDSLTLNASVDVKNPTGDPKETYVQWSCEEAGSALMGNVFTPNESMVGKTYKITATSALTPTISTFVDVVVLPEEAAGNEGVVDGELDGKKYIDLGDNTYKEIREDGSLGPLMCAGLDETIGNYDDRADVVVADRPTPYGVKFLGPIQAGSGVYYLAMGPDNKVGTADDIKVVSESEFPNDLTNIIATSIEITVPEEITSDSNRVKPGKYYDLSAVVMNGSNPSVIQDITWTLNGSKAVDSATTITQEGYLYISGNEPEGTILTVKVDAENLNGDALTASVNFTVRDWELADLKSAPLATITTVEIDGTDFYLLARNGSQALIWTKDVITNAVQFVNPDGSRPKQYEGGYAQTEVLNWINGETTLKNLAKPYTIYTRDKSTENFITSVDQKAFLLSEADLCGTWSQAPSSVLYQDYTYAGKQLISNDNPVRQTLLSSTQDNWLRSTHLGKYSIRIFKYGDVNWVLGSDSVRHPLRPALWIDLSGQQ